jgi:RND superfamily putative drug exporter
LEDVLQVKASVAGSESEAVRLALNSRFAAGDAEYAALVVRGIDAKDAPGDRTRLDSLVTAIAELQGVARVRFYERTRDSLLMGKGGVLVLAVLDPTDSPSDRVIPLLREATAPFASGWSSLGITLRWTGESALNYDLRKASARDATRAELRALPLTGIILLFAFGSLVAAGVPVVVGLLTITCALGTAGLVGRVLPLHLVLQSLVTMLGLGLGIDYGLLMVSRFRESRRGGKTRKESEAITARFGGRTILLSGVAVMLGFGGLLVVPVGEVRSVGFGGLVVVAFAVAVSLTLLPKLLVILDPVLDKLSLSGKRRFTPDLWYRWGRWVSVHPVSVLVAAGLPLLWLCLHATQLRVGTPWESWLPPSIESTRGIEDLRAIERAGLLQMTRVLIQLPDTTEVLSQDGWATVRSIRTHLLADDRIASVLSFAGFTGAQPMSRLAFLTTPQAIRDTYLSDDRRTVLLDVIPTEHTEPEDMLAYVRNMRSTVHARVAEDTQILVGGLPAFHVDYQERVSGYLPMVVVLVVAGTFVALFIGFRSLLIPVKALALNLLSVAAAFGVVKLVFQDGLALAALGLEQPISAVFPVIPTLVFCTVFGLSMDYEVFLVARVAELRRQGVSEPDALAQGLAFSAPVISSAAAIMVVVFGAFALGDYLVIKILGLALAASVFLDATLVRVAVGPALLTLAGRWNWWPGIRTPQNA